MSVLVRDTLSGRPVEVGENGKVGLYICGPTVYNDIHIGNARAPLFWDVVVRYLRSRGYEVTLVQNITDIEDKIINKANEEGVSWEEIVRRYTDSFHERLRMLGVGLPDVEPRGTDLLFPHHENERAQSCGAHSDHAFVRAWVHHGMVNFAADKMAKSVGNIIDVGEAVERHGQNAIRMWFLQSHYSQPIDYSEEILEEKRRSYERLPRLYRQISGSDSSSTVSDELSTELTERFDAAMRDDLNTPEVIAAVFEVAGRAGQEISARPEVAGGFSSLAEAIREVLTIFGFDLAEELVADVDGVRVRYSEEPGEDVLRRVAARELARRGKDWPVADGLRDELGAEGWAV